MINQNLLLAGDDGYNLSRSLRFRGASVGSLVYKYYPITASADTSYQIKTHSFWFKRGKLGTIQILYGNNYDPTTYWEFYINSSDQLVGSSYYGSSNIAEFTTSQVFRDPSAWYHCVVAIDNTPSTPVMRLYINGNQVTSFSSISYGSQNSYAYSFLRNPVSGDYIMAIGCLSAFQSTYNFDGYMTEVHCIDGQALTASSFGEFDIQTGVWKPKKYTGTYGNNGFYLDFSDNTSTTTLGYDRSGNGNNFTTANISLTAGSTYDSMTDVPTLTSTTTANYATLNPLKLNSSTATLSDGNLKVTFPNGGAGGIAMSTISMNTGKFYWEITVNGTDGSTQPKLGVLPVSTFTETSSSIDIGTYGYAYSRNGNKSILGSVSAYGASFTTGDVIGFALDMTAGTLVCYKNNASQGTLASGITGDIAAGLTAYNGYTETVNFGQQPFAYTPPTGFVALNTFNLPEPSIKAGNKHFDILTWSGTGGSAAATRSLTGLNFQPDFSWKKARTSGQSHHLFDSVRGAGLNKTISSDSTNAEGSFNDTLYGYLSSFDGNGITTTNGLSTWDNWNKSGDNYVAWNWKAGNSAGSSNTAGSITSTVSANPTAGFSVVTWTGDGNLGSTVGHGLGVAPKMVIVKNRNNSGAGWYVYHVSVGNTSALFLNQTSASVATSSYWNNTTPTSSVFTIGDSGGVNQSTYPLVAYCFAEVAGYSKFGSYTGNGSTDGTFVHLGFRPKFVMIKSTQTVDYGHWVIKDTSRNSYNAATSNLYANFSYGEDNEPTEYIDILSNGFKIRGTVDGINGSGITYIYMAFAENPTKFALAR